MRKSKHNSGFTLIEVLVAIALFAIMSVMAYGGLESVMRNHEHTRVSMKRLQEIQLAMLTLQRDFEQITHRTASDELGGKLNAIDNNRNPDWLVQFTRLGWSNPANLPRSHLQRAAYRLNEDDDVSTLMRLYWPYVDRASEDQVVEKPLLTRVASAKLRFLDKQQKWQDQWPPVNFDPSNALTNWPIAIELTLELEDWGEITRLFRIPG